MVKPKNVKKVVLAYSGGLDTSVIVPWLRENYGCEVVCFTADVGQAEETDGLEAKALASGASQLIIHDMREEFAHDYIFPVLNAGAVYERKYLLGTSMARPLIAKHQVEVAHQVGADAVAHGATGKGNDQVRFELTYAALDPRLKVIAPWREWDIRSREDAIAYAQAHNVPITQTAKIDLQPRPQPVAPVARGRPAGRPLAGAGRSHVPAFGFAGRPLPTSPKYVEIAFECGDASGGQRRQALARPHWS